MAQQIINIGAVANDGTGDQLRISFDKCNGNFTELYAGKVAKSGDTMTGSLTVAPSIYFVDAVDYITANSGNMYFRSNGTFNWQSIGGGTLMTLSSSTVFMSYGGQLGNSTYPGTLNISFPGNLGPSAVVLRALNDTGAYPVIFRSAGDATVGTISTTAAATAYNTTSDVRLKEDLKSFDAGHIIDDTEVFNFRWKGSSERAYGVSAQQANEVFPEAVTHDEKNDWYGIDYSKYVPVLLQEMKALRARVAQLEGTSVSKPAT